MYRAMHAAVNALVSDDIRLLARIDVREPHCRRRAHRRVCENAPFPKKHRLRKKTRRPPDPLRPLLPYRTAAKASSWRERPGHHLREGAKGLLHVACRSDHYVLGWDKVWEDPPLPDPFTRGSNFEPYLVWPGVSRNPHPGFG